MDALPLDVDTRHGPFHPEAHSLALGVEQHWQHQERNQDYWDRLGHLSSRVTSHSGSLLLTVQSVNPIELAR